MPLDPYGGPPSVAAENIVGQIKSEQIESLDAAKLTGEIGEERITNVRAEAVKGALPAETVTESLEDYDWTEAGIEIPAESVTGTLPAETVTESLKDYDWTEAENAGVEIPASVIIPNILVQNSATSVSYGTTPGALLLLDGSAITIQKSKTVVISAFVNVRRVKGTFDLFIVVNGARKRDIVTDVHGNDLDPVTGFGGFYAENTAGQPHPITYGIGIKCYGDGAQAVVDSYSIKAEWYGA
jgi:hypothetical protein